ncbi:hypothetical protein CSA56_05400 [candidate division KSB3 bacterium]|uniref:HBL/NHE enterotoxin family protein n=1 Tax=candidate division KSB3 bacterium TaxID=2044937 RepID=A0A2G6KHJ9_9BACT|nr:MAG: hypothetical protein CSA56_05400 [candidate division KSB3 bacterium]
MVFEANKVNKNITNGMGAMVMLHSSCQAVIEDEIQQVTSPWYQTLDQELGAAENVVIDWRKNGFLYFKQDILAEIAQAGATFSRGRANIERIFGEIRSSGLTDTLRQQLITAMSALQPPVTNLSAQTEVYLVKLKRFQEDISIPHENMEATIAQVQMRETKLKAEIEAINQHLSNLKNQIAADRTVIAKAKEARKADIVETIFGVLLAPVTGGASLILAGIGVASIAEAEDKINKMQSQIVEYQGQIVSEQKELSDDEKIVTTLNALSMSTEFVLGDISNLTESLSALRVEWDVFNGELTGVIQKVQSAKTAADVAVQGAWFLAACKEWEAVSAFVINLQQRQISTSRIQVS